MKNGVDELVLDYARTRIAPKVEAIQARFAPLVREDRGTIARLEPVRRAPLDLDPILLAHRGKIRVRPIFADIGVISKLPTLIFPTLPPPSPTMPVEEGGFWLWPDSQAGTVYFLRTTPERAEFDLVIEQDAAFRISGGSATLVASVFPVAQTAAQTEAWRAALGRIGIDAGSWRFEPIRINQLEAVLDLPEGHADGPPRITTNPRLGTAIFLIRLTPLGAQVWHQAMTEGGALPGVCTFSVWYAASNLARLIAAQSQSISATLAALTSGVGSEACRVLDPEIAVDASLRVDGDPTISAISLEMRALNQTVRTETFGPEGGTGVMRIVSVNPRAERIDWSTRVVFAAASWPPMRITGVLSDATGWSELLAPSSWLRSVTVTALLLGRDGNVLSPGPDDPLNRVTGTIDFTAPFLEGETSLHTGFETSGQTTTTILVPRPPLEPPGALKLTVFALRDGLDSVVVRDLAPDEQWVLVKVYANGRVEIVTNRSPSSESTREEATALAAQSLAALS